MEQLSEKERQLVAFALFSLSMKLGPASFDHMEKIIEKIGVKSEFVIYATDWTEKAGKQNADKSKFDDFINGMINKIQA